MFGERVLITGASGFIGRYVCKELENIGIEYIGLVHSRDHESKNLLACSILDKDKLRKVISDFQPTSVLHLAAIASPAHNDVTKIYQVNVVGSEILLDALRDRASRKDSLRVILVSSAGVYGNQRKLLLDESTRPSPVNHYSYSKMIMEMLLRQYRNDFSSCIVRPFNIIGAGQQEIFLIPKLVKAFVQRRAVLELGNINTSRDYINVEYAAKAFVKLLTDDVLSESVLNFCSGKATTCLEIIKLLAEMTGHNLEIKISNEFVRRNELYRLVGNPKRFSILMGVNNRPEPLEQILKDMINFYERQ